MADRIVIAADHAAVALKSMLVPWLREQGHQVEDLGTHDERAVDYPDYGYRIARAIAGGRASKGIALCGSGIGIAIAVNRDPACRCAHVHEPLSAKFARSHNDANVIAIGARLVGPEMAKACIRTFLSTDFIGDRHAARVDQLSQPQLAPAREEA